MCSAISAWILTPSGAGQGNRQVVTSIGMIDMHEDRGYAEAAQVWPTLWR